MLGCFLGMVAAALVAYLLNRKFAPNASTLIPTLVAAVNAFAWLKPNYWESDHGYWSNVTGRWVASQSSTSSFSPEAGLILGLLIGIVIGGMFALVRKLPWKRWMK